MALLKLVRALLPFVLALAIAAPAAAQDNVRLVEQDVKAGLLYNFLRYTQWPARPGNTAVVCLYGRDPFAGRLAPMAGRTVNQHVIEVRQVRTFADTDPCTLLYVNAEERARWPQLRAYLSAKDILTVSDYDGFTDAGGMIEFTRIDNRIGMRINVDAVERTNLTVQDRLLRLASPASSRTRPP